MTIEEMWEALEGLAPVGIRLRGANVTWAPRWYAHQDYVNIAGDGVLKGVTGDGASPERAISALWDNTTNLGPGLYLAVEKPGESRRHFVWKGFMWQELARTPPPKEGAKDE